ncbi:MAG: radical SAM family heme chaperone HemW [Alphaproteobacteria bacterium]|nr:radical SAM family heme chaperone HemW [Alphaproteobacteria bacterium]
MNTFKQTAQLRSGTDGLNAPSERGSIDPGFSVYVHWPFCAQKCPYCDFNSHVRFGGADGRSGWDEARFVAAYLRELSYFREQTGPRSVASVFFGGGTPSLMQASTVGTILDEICGLWNLADGAEITLEANPGSVEAARFRGFRAAGVNRVSLGVQSLIEADLKALGRIHSVAEAKAALKIATDTFERVSFDLIYARSGQTLDGWRSELAEALSFGSSHLSLYQLTIEPETMFQKLYAAGQLVIPDAELAADMFELTAEMTQAAGLPAYEVSNHARSGEESRHNMTYWRYGEYVGVGPGAHGRILLDGRARRVGTVTERHPETWVEMVEADGHGELEHEDISQAAAADEMLIMGLRLAEGLDLDRLAQVGGVRPGPESVSLLVDQGVLEVVNSGRSIRAIGAGRLLIDELVRRLSAGLVTVAQ